MGMDVVGRRNKDAYFRANVWSWRPICMIIGLATGTTVPASWGFNDGAGLTTQKQCNELADKLEAWLEKQTVDVFPMETDWDMGVNEAGHLGKKVDGFTRSPYSTDREHVKEFIKFLRICGGFRIL